MDTPQQHYGSSKEFLGEMKKKLQELEIAKVEIVEVEINYDSIFAAAMIDGERSGKPKTALKDLAKTDDKVIQAKKALLMAKNKVDNLSEQCKLLDKQYLLEKEALRSSTALSSILE